LNIIRLPASANNRLVHTIMQVQAIHRCCRRFCSSFKREPI